MRGGGGMGASAAGWPLSTATGGGLIHFLVRAARVEKPQLKEMGGFGEGKEKGGADNKLSYPPQSPSHLPREKPQLKEMGVSERERRCRQKE